MFKPIVNVLYYVNLVAAPAAEDVQKPVAESKPFPSQTINFIIGSIF